MRARAMYTIEEMARKLKPVFGDKIDRLYSQYTLSNNNETKQQIEQVLSALYQKHLNETMLNEKVLLEPPREELIKGEYPLGKVFYANQEIYPFSLREQDWPRHILVSGMSGSGKTNFAFMVLGNLILKKKPFMVFDWKKSFRPLMKVADDVLLFTLANNKVSNNFRININKPPKNVGPKEWIMALCDIISEVFMTSFGVHKLLSEVLDKTFLDFGVYKGSNNYPTWLQIKDRLEDMSREIRRGRESEWLTSAIRIAHTLTFGDFGETINHKGENEMSVDEFLSKQVIFEMNSVSTIEKKFFANYILTFIYKYKKANDNASKEFKHALLVDEAHNIFLKEKPNFNTESITDTIYREIREYGTSLICLDQHISKLSETVVGNSACILGFQQFLPNDLNIISGTMQMYERKRFFAMLPVGHAIVRLAERYNNPFLIKVPLINSINKTASDSEVKDFMKFRLRDYRKQKILTEGISIEKLKKEMNRLDIAFNKSQVKPTTELIMKSAKEIANQTNDEKLKKQIKLKEMSDSLGVDASEDKIILTELLKKLNNQQKNLLSTLQKEPKIGTAKLYKKIGISVRKGNHIRDELIDLGLLKIKEERNERGWKKIFEPTFMALNLLEV